EGEVRRAGAAAGIEVAAAGDDDLRALGERSGCEPETVEVLAPHRTRDGAALVAQLEVDARSREPDVARLAGQLDVGEAPQAVAQRRGVLAHAEGPGERGSGDACCCRGDGHPWTVRSGTDGQCRADGAGFSSASAMPAR